MLQNTKSSGRSKRLRIVAILVIITLVGGCAAVYTKFYALDGASFEQGQERADALIIALEMYKQERGRYPASLSALIPDFLPEIPRPAWGYEYRYLVCKEGVGYAISFRERADADDFCGFDSVTGEWRCLDSTLPSPLCNWDWREQTN